MQKKVKLTMFALYSSTLVMAATASTVSAATAAPLDEVGAVYAQLMSARKAKASMGGYSTSTVTQLSGPLLQP